MTIYIADQNSVLFKYESGTYGTASGESGNWLGLVTEHSPTDEENVMTIRYAGTSNRNVNQLINGPKDYTADLTYHPQDFRMFGFALGSTVDAGSPSPYTHAISELNSDDGYAYNDSAFPSFTIVDSKKSTSGDGNHQVRTYKGCKVNTLSYNVSQGEAVSCDLTYVAQSLELGSKTTDILSLRDEDTSRPYLWSDVQFHLPSGTKMTEVNELTWSVNNNLDSRHYVNGSKVIQNAVPLNREYEVTLTLDANNTWGKSLYEQYWQGGSSFNCMIENNLSAGSESGFFIMSGCKITSFEAPSPAEGIDEYSLTIIPSTCSINATDLMYKYNAW